ncbi:MAG: hypothetical protein EBS05_22435 [Proteobacteria bacterium]|nr:hypothetical protein [Pseudomonadota bacterium]NDF01383.1 hypothetical protein [Verrucomicrobiota bacterium]
MNAEQVAQFDTAMQSRGVAVERETESVTRDLQSHSVETRVTGCLKREADFAEFTLEGVPQVTNAQGAAANYGGCMLRIGTLTDLHGHQDAGEKRLADEVAQAFPGTLEMSPESLNQTLSRVDWWKNLAGVSCLILVAAIVFGLLALALYGAVKLFF